MIARGKLIGIGVGPGASDLMTLKAVNILKTITVVAVPCASPEKESLALLTAKEAINPQAEILKLHFAMVKDESTRREYRHRAAERIAEYLDAGSDVAFLTEGDVMLYSTFSYMLEYLGDRFAVEIVPGISSMMASAAAACLPLAINDQRLALLPATHENLDELEQALRAYDTVVLLKVSRVIESLITVLKEIGRLDQAVVVEHASLENSRVLTDIAELKNGQLPYMSQLIVSQNTQTSSSIASAIFG